MGTKKSIKYSPGMQDWLGNLPKDQRVQYSALAGSGRTDDDVPGFISTEAEGPLLNGSLENGNAFVVLGVDRNSTPLSGYGGLGHTRQHRVKPLTKQQIMFTVTRDLKQTLPGSTYLRSHMWIHILD